MDRRPGTAEMLVRLLDDAHFAALEQIPALVAEHAARAGLYDVRVYLADLQQNVLRPLTALGEIAAKDKADTGDTAGTEEMAGGQMFAGEPGTEEVTELSVEGTLAGRVFQETRILSSAAPGGGTILWVPMLDGVERLGVIRAATRDPRDAPSHGDEATDAAAEELPRETGFAYREAAESLASLVALLVISKRPYSDSYARLVRRKPMNVAAEMQWNLTPPLTFANETMVIGAVLEPAYEIGGDAFDYAIAGDVVHLAIFDAMGHDTSAGLTANLAVAACRNHRRQGAGLVETSENVERVLIEEFGRGVRFVTAIMAHLDLTTGLLTWVNRGHHPPVVIRDGRWTSTLECPPSHPLGLDLGIPVTLCREQLEPGDRLLLYTDGITEARNRHGQEFGLHHFVDFIIRHNAAGLAVPETLRRLIRNVLDYHSGELQDDATVLLAEWRGGGARRLAPRA
ncbi:PP2C family protein-serine/threonine phosphatase [Sphaerisporangium rhizosphaerae]|uniref:PP2C family protein-serine/threonine phosphatase n=1 Tax=Sphaerisporangium rhizosphaerae TaxID=2269375 RepID=A0ABW2PDK5_9ACTN